MSHMRTTTRISVKNEDCCSIPGLLRVTETVFGSICLGLMLYYTSFKGTNSFGMFGHEMYFILTAFGCLLCPFLLLVSSCWSFTSSSLLSRTSFEILFHLVACALYLAAGITLLTKTLDTHPRYKGEVYDAKIAAAVFGIMNGGPCTSSVLCSPSASSDRDEAFTAIVVS
uniref:Putative members of chemokine-like factor super family n=1 Tax=Ixodes ricinus TaxID=34613 RepID=A0A0K8RHT4_IXORI